MWFKLKEFFAHWFKSGQLKVGNKIMDFPLYTLDGK